MRLSTLTPKQRRMLAHFSGPTEWSFKDVARTYKVTEQTARRLFATAVSNRYFRPSCFINHPALGLQTFNVYFSCPREKAASVISFLDQDPRVVFATENTGSPRFQVTAVSRSAKDIHNLLSEISSSCDTPLTSRSWAIESALYYWGSRGLSPEYKPARFELATTRPLDLDLLDLLDLKILDLLRSALCDNTTEIARALKEPLTTITYRLNRLRTNHVVSPVFY